MASASTSSSFSLPPSNNKTVLITGINGYIASHLGLALLKLGYHVRGTSRSASSGPHLLSEAFLGFSSRYTHLVVPDITLPNAFDTAVPNCHAIIHTASPVDFTLTTVSAYFDPAVKGILSILNSAHTHSGPHLSHFTLLSSNAAIADRWRLPPNHTYTESDWNLTGESIALASESAAAAGTGPFLPMVAYGASKAASERAMWDWRSTHTPPWAITAINPSVVTGPPIHWPSHPSQLNSTLLPIWNIFSASGPAAHTIPAGIGGMSFIDVRDLVALHIWVLQHPTQSNGERYLCTNGKGTPQAIADILRAAYPNRKIVVGDPGCDYDTQNYWWPEGEASMVAHKAYKALGMERFAVNFDRSVLDTARSFEERWGELLGNRKG